MIRMHTLHVGPSEAAALAPRLHRLWQHLPGTFWLDSAFTANTLGRYSFLGTDPSLWLETVGDTTSVVADGQRQKFSDDPFVVLSRLAAPLLEQRVVHDTIPFCGGFVGYMGYDLGRQRAGITTPRHHLPSAAPLQAFGYYDAVVCLDHHTGDVHLITTDLCARGLPQQGKAIQRLAWLDEAVSIASATEYTPPTVAPDHFDWRLPQTVPASQLQSNFTPHRYADTVQHVLAEIAEGTFEQVNLAQRFSMPFDGSPASLYERLRRVSPAPYAALLSHGSRWFLSSSPERFLKIKDDLIEMRPIKGTRPRGRDATSDARLRHELLSSTKDEAEHTMIVDLQLQEMADLCVPGTVHVADRLVCEQYATVFHLVSTLRGQLTPGIDKIMAVADLFPGSSVTGRPKAAAMEAIAMYEPEPRGVYTGGIGYIGIGGNIDFNVAIRTMIVEDGQVHFHVGGALVAQSSPWDEYEETLDKAEGMVQALFAADR